MTGFREAAGLGVVGAQVSLQLAHPKKGVSAKWPIDLLFPRQGAQAPRPA